MLKRFFFLNLLTKPWTFFNSSVIEKKIEGKICQAGSVVFIHIRSIYVRQIHNCRQNVIFMKARIDGLESHDKKGIGTQKV